MRKWFHITFSMYGTWLPGDPRGFRTWKHKIHSSGDYKRRPPKGEHEALQRLTRSTMRAAPVTLTRQQRETCARAIVDKLTEKGCDVIAVAVAGQHVHIQVRIQDHDIKRVIGLAKQLASHRVRDELPGTIWGARRHLDPIRSRDHQKRVYGYIQRHKREGAYVWTFKDDQRPP